MFGNLNKPAFGTAAPNTSFGFATSTSNPTNLFGQNQIFGKSAGAFGSPSTSAFGQAPGTLFPSTQAPNTNLFQNANTGFGTTTSAQSTGFGSANPFGQQQQPQQSAATGLFNTTSTFGQQNKTAGFGFTGQPSQPTLFGQAQPQQQQQTTNIFQPSTSNLFGSSSAFGQQSTGTGAVKFNPVTGTDTMMKNGAATSINTKHHSITCMKEYENKSFEELRFEDYAANRKGPQQQPGFGATPFGGAVSSAPLFGQTDASKPAFGAFGQQATPAFGQNTAFGMTNQQQQSGGLFGKPATGFGTATSTPSMNFGFGTNTQMNNPFGGTQQPKTFGTAAPSIFGTNTTTTQSTAFGTTGGGLFGQTNPQNTAGSLFAKPAQPTTGFGATPSAPFSFATPASTQASNLFQPNKPLFGQPTTTPAFGQTNTFGANTFNSFAKPAAPAFGATPTPAFAGLGTGLQPQANSLFVNNNAKPGGLFTNTNSTGLFNNTNTSFQPNTGFALQTQQAQQSVFPSTDQQLATNLAMLTADPFGDAPHFAGLEPKLKTSSPAVSATDPKELKSLLDASRKVDNSGASKLKVVPIRSVRDSLFEGISPTLNGDINSKNYVKTNCRRLILKNRPSAGGEQNSPGLARTDILKHINASINDENFNPDSSKTENSLSSEIKKSPLRINFENVNDDSSKSVVSQNFLLDNSIIKNTSQESINNKEIEVEMEPVANAMGDIPKQYPCNIVCTRPEYYILPSPEELEKYIDENGCCMVKGFTIGRKGYGNVYFPEEMDVYGLNIDELVQFRYREINVYPDDDKKPPVGQGLNRKAQVTLDNIYPRKPGTSVLIKDVNELRQLNFAEKLRKITVNKDAKFVDYRPETGSWVFKVDHFSRYGFDEGDEDAVQVNGKDAAEKKAVETGSKPDVASAVSKTITAVIEKTTSKSTTTDPQLPKFGLDEDMFVDDVAHFQAEGDVLQTSMYVDNISEDNYRMIPPDIPLHIRPHTFSTSKDIQVMKSMLFADDDRSSDGGGSHISIIRQYLDIPDEIRALPVVEREIAPKKKILLRPKVDKVYNFSDHEIGSDLMQLRSYQDLAVFKGKSFKVGWSKGCNFYSLFNKQIGGAQLVLNDIKCGTQQKFKPIDVILNESLNIVLKESTSSKDNNRIPTFNIIKNHSYLKKQTKLFTDLMENYKNAESKYLHSIWTLAEALWGPGENTCWHRRLLLSEWLKYNTHHETITDQPVTEIFNHLSVFKIKEAANLALEKLHPNLALIISQLSVTNRTKMFLQEQIENWYKSMTANHINEELKKIYLLLAGMPFKDDVNVFENIDWKRAFGLHLWYISPVGAPIEMVIELYKKAFEECSYAESPNPPYRVAVEDDGAFDLLYHILLLYRSRGHRLSTVLNSSTHTDNYVDYWLSWLLLQLFLSLDVGIMDDFEKRKLCTSFSNQLESIDEWEWAIFVLLHLEDNNLKKKLVMDILDRNLSPDVNKCTIKSENNLVNRMHIPSEWIHTVKGHKTVLAERYFEAFNHFALAKDYCKANEILVDHLLPSLFINQQYDIIKFLIGEIEEGSREIDHWSNEAGLFKDFIELQERFVSTEDNIRIQMNLQSISNRITNFIPKTNHQKLCIAEMSKRCASIYKEFCKKSHSTVFKNSYLEFVENLNMPPDFKQNEALYLINETGSRC